MRWLVWVILLFSAAVAISLVARFSHGNVAILWPPYRVDVSVNFALALLAALFIFLHLFLLAIGKLFALSKRVREYRETREREKAHDALAASLLASFEGRYGRAERLARGAQSHAQTSSLAALVAARAAHRMREFKRRDDWLVQANDPAARAARLLTQAELLVEEQKPVEALEAISQAQKAGSRHIHSLRLALRAHEQNGDWAQVIRLTQTLDKRDALHPSASIQYRLSAYRKLLLNSEGAQLNQLWNEIKKQPEIKNRLAGDVAALLKSKDLHAAARTIYETQLDEEFSVTYLRAYLSDAELSLAARLQRVQVWADRYGEEPELLAALGELCRREKLWGKAQSYLEQSLSKRASVAAHYSLAELFESIERPEQAQEQYRLAAKLANDHTAISSTRTNPLSVPQSNRFE
jgi:HemY protein